MLTNPVPRAIIIAFSLRIRKKNAVMAQVVEHVLGKDEVTSSNLVNSSIFFHALPNPKSDLLLWLRW